MRRTTAFRQPLLELFQDPCLADLVCEACWTVGCTVFVSQRTDNGASEHTFCRIDPCAISKGWPGRLPSERTRHE